MCGTNAAGSERNLDSDTNFPGFTKPEREKWDRGPRVVLIETSVVEEIQSALENPRSGEQWSGCTVVDTFGDRLQNLDI